MEDQREARYEGDYAFQNRLIYRIAPRRIHVKATLPDGTEREAEFPEPVEKILRIGDVLYRSDGDMRPHEFKFTANTAKRKWVDAGRVFDSYEAALERDKAMIWISGGEVE